MRRNAFWGVLLIVVGILFLADSMNIIDIDVWGALWALVIMGLGLWLLLQFTFTREMKDTGSIAIPLELVSQAKIVLRHGAGRLSVRGGADAGDLITGTYNGRLSHKSKTVGDVQEVKIREHTGLFPFAEPRQWTLRLSDQIRTSLEIHSGASETRVDLTDLNVSDVRVSTGASDTLVTLPAKAGFTKAEVSAGAASIRVRIPEGVAASIRVSGGLSSTNIDRKRFPRSAGRFQSPDYETAENKVELRVSTGVGSIDVR